jgi:hypothetical protein
MTDIQAGNLWTYTAVEVAHNAGVTTYQVLSQEDKIVCPVCKRLNGHTFSVQDTRERIQQGLAKVKTQPPPKPKAAPPKPKPTLPPKKSKHVNPHGVSLPIAPQPYQKAKTTAEAKKYVKDKLVKPGKTVGNIAKIEVGQQNVVNQELTNYLGRYRGMPDKLHGYLVYTKKSANMSVKGTKLYMNKMYLKKNADYSWDLSTKSLKSGKYPGYWSVKSHFPKDIATKITADHEIGHIWQHNVESMAKKGDKWANSLWMIGIKPIRA